LGAALAALTAGVAFLAYLMTGLAAGLGAALAALAAGLAATGIF